MKDALLTQAQKHEPPGETAIREFADKWENMAATGTRLLMARPDLAKLVGRGNEKMAEDNNRNFLRFMLSLFSDYQPAVFVETVLWVFRAYRSHGFQTTYWAAWMWYCRISWARRFAGRSSRTRFLTARS